MIFLNPWALLGVLAIAAPVVAHLLGRRPARRLLFPTLRFLPATTPSPVRRDRLADLGLLALRIAVIAGAAAALAQPVWLSSGRARELGTQIARAVIVDTGASMSRRTGAGGRAIDVARQEAADASRDATMARVAEAAEPASALRAAATWLLTQPMRREVVVISDFQTSAMGRDDLERLPAGVGLRLIKVPASGEVATPPGGRREVALLGSAAERGGAIAARSAAVAQGAPALGREDRPAAIVFPGFEARPSLLQRARPLDAPWMADAMLSVADDPLVAAAAERLGHSPLDLLSAAGDPDERTRLLIFVDTPPATLFSAAVIRSVLEATASETPANENVTTSYSTDELRSWEREPKNVAAADASPDPSWSDGRWVWGAGVLLLVVETIVRRRRRVPLETENHALVA